MLPVIALIGRPNVGKSTLFNQLTRSRDALVADFPGLTRDRQYGNGKVGECPYIVVDTGGLVGDEHGGLNGLMADQVWVAVEEADVVLFLLDARDGINLSDEQIADRLRRSGKTACLVLNKTDGVDTDTVISDAYALGLGEPARIAAAHGRGIGSLMERVLAELPVAEDVGAATDPVMDGIRIAVVGRPNVGKSTLTNRMLGEERVLAFDKPGTTRDSIYIPLERDGDRYTLIDTAGVRRRSKVSEVIEKFSIIKTLQAINDANVVILVLDAHLEVSEQDATLAGHVVESGTALVLAVNKWDGIADDERQWFRDQLDRRLPFLEFAERYFISALHGSGVGNLFEAVQEAYQAAIIKVATPELTRLLERAVHEHQPPLVRGRRIKLRNAHQGGQNPPVIVIHGNQTRRLPPTYKRYLINYFRKALRLVGTPIRLQFKTGENPYEGKRNKLTPRQQRSRKRMIQHVKKK